MAKEKNGVSILFWMIAMVAVWLPCIGVLIAIPFALFGENESRKNFFRARLVWELLMFLILGGLALLGFLPALIDLAYKTVEHLPTYFKGQ